MRSKRWAAVTVAAVALIAIPVAAAGMMHPTLGARLSGMGEQGIANLQAHAAKHELCWTFQISTMHATAATVRDKGGMIVARLGHMYRAKGCAMVAKRSLALIESKPGNYWVWVATKAHPGELRGKLSAGMAHM
jgi:hypothetical protein